MKERLTRVAAVVVFILCAFSVQASASVIVPDVPSTPAPLTCTTDDDCADDGLYCNGDEVCDAGECASTGDPCAFVPDSVPAIVSGQVCDEESDTCVECLDDGDCSGADVCVNKFCVECGDDGDCIDDGDPCNGNEVCSQNQCVSEGNPCQPGEICVPAAPAAAPPAVLPPPPPPPYSCVECDNDTQCDDGRFCTGYEQCLSNTCVSMGDPCLVDPSSMPMGRIAGPVCDEANDTCVECLTDDNCTDNATPFCVSNVCVECRNSADCDNGLFCDGAEYCEDDGACYDGEPPCDDNGTMALCNEELDQCAECLDEGDCLGDNSTPLCDGVMCVQCLTDTDCDNGTVCREAECTADLCELMIKPRKVRLGRKFRPIQRMFRIRGPEPFGPDVEVDFGVMQVRRVFVNKKGVLKVLAVIPAGAGLNKGPYEIRVGDCAGEILLR